ncbi:MAG: DUF3944 domain-containing protein [Gallionella sp.]|nr:DUF3944 domain-containing protein [Gallionella sp.]MDD4946830.1 DUF3944 domain-containing protein [Gallionella sp.]
MGIKFREDPDLQFLAHAKNEDLQILVDYLTKDKDGEKRFAQELLDEKRFIAPKYSLSEVWDLIAAELQLFGGDAIANQVRGHGVLYKEILCDACDHLSVKYDKTQSAYEIESSVMEDMMEKFWKDLTLQRRAEIKDTLGISSELNGDALLKEILRMIRSEASISYRAAGLLANSFAFALLGRGLGNLVGFGVSRYLGALAGPIGIAAAALLTLFSFSGPAYRVTIPCVIQIAYMRRVMAQTDRY